MYFYNFTGRPAYIRQASMPAYAFIFKDGGVSLIRRTLDSCLFPEGSFKPCIIECYEMLLICTKTKTALFEFLEEFPYNFDKKYPELAGFTTNLQRSNDNAYIEFANTKHHAIT